MKVSSPLHNIPVMATYYCGPVLFFPEIYGMEKLTPAHLTSVLFALGLIAYAIYLHVKLEQSTGGEKRDGNANNKTKKIFLWEISMGINRFFHKVKVYALTVCVLYLALMIIALCSPPILGIQSETAIFQSIAVAHIISFIFIFWNFNMISNE